ncbi:MAG: Mpo1-like protein [Polyangiales bacterium]
MAASPFRPAIDLLAQYAEYHRDRRNIATHFVGIPAIVLAIMVLLARPLGGALSWLAVLFAAQFYLRLDLRWGVVMSALFALAAWLGVTIAVHAYWFGPVLFVGGWALQFLGHVYEGKKPAFLDDLRGLLIGPLFVVVELLFALGLLRTLQQELRSREDALTVDALV